MPSKRKLDSARANGAKSQGPVSEEGRRRSSRNALTHGLYSASVVLPTESRDEYHALLESYQQQFQPGGQAEFDLIEEMVNAKWRQRRLWAIESDLLEDQMIEQKERLDAAQDTYDPITPLSFAYKALAGGSARLPHPPRIATRARLLPRSQKLAGAPEAPPRLAACR